MSRCEVRKRRIDRQTERTRAAKDGKGRDFSSICASDIRTAGCWILEECCLSNLWEAITYTVLHKDKHTQKESTQADIHFHIYTRAHTHTQALECIQQWKDDHTCTYTEIPTHMHTHCALHATNRRRSLINSTWAHCGKLRMIFNLNSTLSTQALIQPDFQVADERRKWGEIPKNLSKRMQI